MLKAALAGFGLAYVPEDLAQPHLAKGRLKRVLENWCAPFSGYHLYYPNRRQLTPAFACSWKRSVTGAGKPIHSDGPETALARL
jgi:DNA-binding transcriptional LysR family regulator